MLSATLPFMLMLLYFQSACEMDGSLCGAKGVCIPNYQDDSVRCSCSDGYAGIPCSKFLLTCLVEVMESANIQSDKYGVGKVRSTTDR